MGTSIVTSFATTALADCGHEAMAALGHATVACGEGPMMKMIKSGEIQPMPSRMTPDQCPPMAGFQALLSEIRHSVDCLLQEAGWWHEDDKIKAFLDNLPEPGADKMAVCIVDAIEAGKAFFSICDTAGVSADDLVALQQDNEAAVRLFCLNEQLIHSHCIEVTDDIAKIQAVLNPHHG